MARYQLQLCRQRLDNWVNSLGKADQFTRGSFKQIKRMTAAERVLPTSHKYHEKKESRVLPWGGQRNAGGYRPAQH